MASYTITTPVNIDTLTAKTGSDTYTINGGYLTVDQHSRYGTNQNTSAAMGNITLSATLGGTIEFNSTLVRLIPYNTGTGNVPALGTTISRGSASAILLGVYSALNVAPTAAASAMPASGYILVRQWNSVAYTAGALTGIGATATGADRAGWLEIVGVDALAVTVNRLNMFKVRGDWYDFLGVTTDGNRATTYQIPSNGASVYLPGVWVETSVADVYEFYPCAGTLAATAENVGTEYERGRWCWISTAGLVRFGHDGTNSTGGYIPPSGRKIRIPNIFFMTCTAATPTANVVPNATPGTRLEFVTTGGGAIDIDKASMNWYLIGQQAYSMSLTHSSFMTLLVITECATAVTLNDVGIGQEATNTQVGLTLSFCFAGGTVTDCVFIRYSQTSSTSHCVLSDTITGFTFTRCRTHAQVYRTNANAASWGMTRPTDCSWVDCLNGANLASITTGTNITWTRTSFYDHPSLNSLTSMANTVWTVIASCVNCLFDGLTFPVAKNACTSSLLVVSSSGCRDITLRNIGTPTTPLDCGGPQQNDKAWTRSTTTATVTHVAHGLRVNDVIYVIVSDSTAAITVAQKTVGTVPTADTFTFTCLNAGNASGVLSYYLTQAAYVVSTSSGAAAVNVRVQRVYVEHLRSAFISLDNSSKGFLFDGVTFNDYFFNTGLPALNMTVRMIGSLLGGAAQTSCYGTHWADGYTGRLSPNLSAQSWSRVTTLCTVTSADHGLRTGELINVTVSSATGAVSLGQKSITALNKDTFTFTCLNASSTSGTLTYENLASRICIYMNEATAETASVYTIDAGTPKFTSAGSMLMANVNDQITFETPYWVLGHTGFAYGEVIMAGGTLANYDLLYALDVGSGHGSWKNLSYTRAGAGGSNASTTITMTSTTGVNVDDYVWGTNVAPYARVVSVDSGTNITVTVANTGTVSGTLRFSAIYGEPTIGAAGFKLKVRITTMVANTTAISSLYAFTLSTATSRQAQYPLDTVAVAVTALDASTSAAVEDARVLLRASSGTTVTITRSSTTATVAHTAHGFAPGSKVVISGAVQGEYNGLKTITVVDANSYTFTVSGSPTTPATGTITSYRVVLDDVTDVDGLCTANVELTTSTLAVVGTARRASSAPYYKPSPLSGTITSAGLSLTSYLVGDS